LGSGACRRQRGNERAVIPGYVYFILLESEMVYDLRTFTVATGRFAEFMALHKEIALPLLRKYLGEPVGYWSSITGEMNQFIHLWKFEDFHDLEKRQSDLNNDAAWRDYVVNILGKAAILQRQQSVLMKPIVV
jgi:hypothetical protein